LSGAGLIPDSLALNPAADAQYRRHMTLPRHDVMVELVRAEPIRRWLTGLFTYGI
jgi:hypothetical protein